MSAIAEYWGHSENGGGHGVPEALKDHLELVATRAKGYAAQFGAGELADAAGLLHDLGKLADQFQRRVRGQREPGKDHWSAGAFAAVDCYKQVGLPMALCIEGHHIGLQQFQSPQDFRQCLMNRFRDRADEVTDADLALLVKRFHEIGLKFPTLAAVCDASTGTAGDMLDVRMLFSCLVDADFLETEAHFHGDRSTPRRYRADPQQLDFRAALNRVCDHVGSLANSGGSDPEIQSIRSSLFEQCLSTARSAPVGLFSLAAPTGAGKTLAMLAFALQHAIDQRLTRIVLVMPYLNIIDQTARLYRKLFSAEQGFDTACVLEDHSLADSPANDDPDSTNDPQAESLGRLRRLLAQNWEAPIVLTTSVKALESLHAHKPSACRKLHRLARSVILFDEVQTIPPELSVATLATLSRLSERYGTSVVFATATQPAFEHLDGEVRRLALSGWRPRPIVPDTGPMFQHAAKRVAVRWRIGEPLPWDRLAQELARANEGQVLCVVNLKRHAMELVGRLRDLGCRGLKHLSTNMCAVHRERVLDEVRQALDPQSSAPVCLVATQCVEAGVDLDFPVVFRALAPLEAIAQASGRCNRHGVRPERGRVEVFMPPRDERALYPPGAYQRAAETTEIFLNGLLREARDFDGPEILNDPGRIRAYYQMFYDLTGISSRNKDLIAAIERGDFVEVDERYRLIDQDGINILVPYDGREFRRLRREIGDSADRGPGFIREWIARARRHSVSTHRPPRESALWNYLRPVQFSRRQEVDNDDADWFVCLDEAVYDRDTLGLRTAIEFSGVI